MDWAIGAGGFFDPELAALEADGGVVEELLAVSAEAWASAMILCAEQLHHSGHRAPFTVKARGGELRDLRLSNRHV